MITTGMVVALLIATLGTAIYFNHENKKAYTKGFHDAMAARILAIHKEGETAYGVEWEQDDDGRQ